MRSLPALLVTIALGVGPARAEEHFERKPDPAQKKEGAQEFVLKKDPARKPSFLEGVKRSVSHALTRLWEKEQPDAARGNLLAAENNPQGALEAYDAAEKKLPQGTDAAAALAFNRSGALLKGEATEAPKALEQAMRAQASGDQSLRAKAAYNAALALEQAGKTDEAVQAYGQALRLDADDVDSKVNLELLLQQKERQKKQPSQGPQDKDQKNQDKKEDQQKQDQAKGEDKKDDKQQGQEEKQKEEQQQKPEQGEDKKKGQEKEQDQAKEQKKEEQQQEMGRSEAQRLLDAAKAGEKNLQVWRFGKKPEKDRRRSPVEKDW